MKEFEFWVSFESQVKVTIKAKPEDGARKKMERKAPKVRPETLEMDWEFSGEVEND